MYPDIGRVRPRIYSLRPNSVAFAVSPMSRLPARQIAPQAARMVVHVVIRLDFLAPVKARPRAQ